MLAMIDNPNYKVSSVVLTKSESFTVKEIECELKEKGETLQEDVIKKVLMELMDSGIIILSGREYFLSID